MSASSLASAFSLAVQSGKGTAATTGFHTALATVSGLDPEFDKIEPIAEHPSSASRSTHRKSSTQRSGYLVPVNASFLLHPRFIGKVLRAMGCGVTTVNNTTHYTHTFKLAADASIAWMSAIHLWSGATNKERKAVDVRGEQLQINVDTANIQCQFQGVGLTEGNSTGSETKTAEDTTLLSPYTGSTTFKIGATTVATTLRGNQFQMQQTLDRDSRILHQAARADMPRTDYDITGTLQGIDIDQGTYEHYMRIKRGGTGGTAPSLTPATGELTWTFASLANITGAAVPYSLTVDLVEAEYDMVSPNANGRDIIRADITYSMLDTSTDPLVITLVNDIASYA